jgi:hypothetical protein
MTIIEDITPKKDGDIFTGPFMEPTVLRAGLEEMEKLSVQAGEILCDFLPEKYKFNEDYVVW